MLGSIPAGFEEIGHAPSYFNLDSWDREMGEAMTPKLAMYWDEAGQSVRERMGLDPDSWRVTDPHLEEAIRGQAFAFCESTNKTTTAALGDAHEQVRQALLDGVLTQGEAIPELTKRIKAVYRDLSDRRANLIAITEASRAVHTASLMSARSSGVATRKKWLLSANACPKCHAIADRVNPEGIPLDEDFAVSGTNPAYMNISMPPAHPRCRCTATFVVDPGYLESLGIDPSSVGGDVAAVEGEAA